MFSFWRSSEHCFIGVHIENRSQVMSLFSLLAAFCIKFLSSNILFLIPDSNNQFIQSWWYIAIYVKTKRNVFLSNPSQLKALGYILITKGEDSLPALNFRAYVAFCTMQCCRVLSEVTGWIGWKGQTLQMTEYAQDIPLIDKQEKNKR